MFAAVDDSAPASSEAEPFSIRVGVRFRPPASPDATDGADDKPGTTGVCLPLHQKLQLLPHETHTATMNGHYSKYWS